MKWTEGRIEGVQVRAARRYEDARGWLAEIFRSDETDPTLMPVMGYLSVTKPGVTRGPHEHREQTDTFGLLGPGTFRVRMWDNRKTSPTYGRCQTVTAGDRQPLIIMVPPGVVHAYTNISASDAWVVNCPNRLYGGPGRKQPVDEVRYENQPDSGFDMK